MANGNGSVCIPKWQRNLHIAGEVAAVAIQLPLMIELVRHKGPMTKKQKRRLKMMVAGTLAVDGALLIAWAAKR